MKKFRVAKSDGTSVIIEAQNIDEAILIARKKFGPLPNDVNKKITDDALNSIQISMKELESYYKAIKLSEKELDWKEVYLTIHKIVDTFNVVGNDLKKFSENMVGIKLGEDL